MFLKKCPAWVHKVIRRSGSTGITKTMCPENIYGGCRNIDGIPEQFYAFSLSSGGMAATRNCKSEGDVLDALKQGRNINITASTLRFPSNSISGGSWPALSDALKSNSTLTALDLSRNPIGQDGEVALYRALKRNTTVTAIALERDGLIKSELAINNGNYCTILAISNTLSNQLGYNESNELRSSKTDAEKEGRKSCGSFESKELVHVYW